MFNSLVSRLIGHANKIVLLIVALALVVFIYGLVEYITSADDKEKRKEGVTYITFGIIGLTVMVSVWGILSILTGTFNFGFGIPQLTY